MKPPAVVIAIGVVVMATQIFSLDARPGVFCMGVAVALVGGGWAVDVAERKL